jgi:hypothetical protein
MKEPAAIGQNHFAAKTIVAKTEALSTMSLNWTLYNLPVHLTTCSDSLLLPRGGA